MSFNSFNEKCFCEDTSETLHLLKCGHGMHLACAEQSRLYNNALCSWCREPIHFMDPAIQRTYNPPPARPMPPPAQPMPSPVQPQFSVQHLIPPNPGPNVPNLNTYLVSGTTQIMSIPSYLVSGTTQIMSIGHVSSDENIPNLISPYPHIYDIPLQGYNSLYDDL